MSRPAVPEELLRRLAPEVLGAVVRRYGHFDLAEDAVQEALLAAAVRWASDGLPESPRGWLITVAARRLTDALRSEQARREREDVVAAWTPAESWMAGEDGSVARDTDDSLVLLFLCCHPVLSPSSQIALTLRAVSGLTTAEIARAFLVPEDTMTRRISRAKRAIAASRVPFRLPRPAERAERLRAVLHVLYLVFTQGYAATSGPRVHRVELSGEAIRLARTLVRLLPGDPEAQGLLALMLLTDARRAARTGADGGPVPMAEQDRRLWDGDLIAEGVALVTDAMTRGPVGPYQLQAAIAALHDEARDARDTDWPQILMLYELLLRDGENPVVRLNHAVALAMVRGPEAGLERLDALRADDRVAQDHRLHAVRGHLLELAGRHAAARASYLAAAERTTSLPRRRHLHALAARLAEGKVP